MITKLREYLDLHHITHRGFASDIGMSIATMHNILNGKHLPNIVHAVAIEKKTRGFVRVEDWLDEKYRPKNTDKRKKDKDTDNVTKRPELGIPNKGSK